MMHELQMKRGRRRVFIGLFPRRQRAESVAAQMEWDISWKPLIRETTVKYNPRPELSMVEKEDAA